MIRFPAIFLSICALPLLVCHTARAAQYQVRALPGSGLNVNGHAYDINDSGQIVGSLWRGAYGWISPRSALWNPDGSLSGDCGQFRKAYSINNSEVVAGDGFVWSKSAGSTQYSGYTCHSISDSGWIAGRYTTGSHYVAVAWDPAGVATNLPYTGNFSDWMAVGVNYSGTIVGFADNSTRGENTVQALMWDSTHGLRILPGPGGVGRGACATSINDSGFIVGRTDFMHPENGHGVLWKPDGTFVDLYTEATGWMMYALYINNVGQITGASSAGPMVLNPDGTFNMLPLLPGYSSAVAGAINNHGQIVGYCLNSKSEPTPVVWTLVVPEPSCVATLLCGTLALLGIARRRWK